MSRPNPGSTATDADMKSGRHTQQVDLGAWNEVYQELLPVAGAENSRILVDTMENTRQLSLPILTYFHSSASSEWTQARFRESCASLGHAVCARNIMEDDIKNISLYCDKPLPRCRGALKLISNMIFKIHKGLDSDAITDRVRSGVMNSDYSEDGRVTVSRNIYILALPISSLIKDNDLSTALSRLTHPSAVQVGELKEECTTFVTKTIKINKRDIKWDEVLQVLNSMSTHVDTVYAQSILSSGGQGIEISDLDQTLSMLSKLLPKVIESTEQVRNAEQLLIQLTYMGLE